MGSVSAVAPQPGRPLEVSWHEREEIVDPPLLHVEEIVRAIGLEGPLADAKGPAGGLALQPGHGDSLDKVLLREQVDHEHRDHAHGSCRHK